MWVVQMELFSLVARETAWQLGVTDKNTSFETPSKSLQRGLVADRDSGTELEGSARL